MQSEHIRFTNRKGQALAAILDRPASGTPKACAVFAHCFTCSKDLNAVRHLARSLAAEGLAVLRFDFTGLGQSEGEFSDSTFSSNVQDIEDAAAYLADRYEAPAMLIGHSLGGAAVLQAATRIDSIRAVATIGAPFDPGHVTQLFGDSLDTIRERGSATVKIAGRSFEVDEAFVDDLEEQKVQARLRGLDAALLIMHSPVDSIVSIDNAALIYEAARHPKSFISLDRADHLLSEPRDARYAGSVLAAWAARYVVDGEAAPDTEAHGHHATATIGRERYYTGLTAGRHSMVADEPASLGGTDQGPTPYELVLAGLGGCTAITMRMYADRKEWPMDGVHVELTHKKMRPEDCDCDAGDRKRVDLIERTISIEGDDLDEAQRARLLEIADRCPVHRSLHEGWFVVKTRPGK